MTAEEAISYSQEKSKNNKSIYSAPKEWSTAKNEVEHGILKLFPVRVR